MEPLKRISSREVKNYIELSIYDDKVCTKSIAFTLREVPNGIYPDSLYNTPWQEVTYYGDESSITNKPLSPLEYMHKEWEMNKDVNEVGERGDEGLSRV